MITLCSPWGRAVCGCWTGCGRSWWWPTRLRHTRPGWRATAGWWRTGWCWCWPTGTYCREGRGSLLVSDPTSSTSWNITSSQGSILNKQAQNFLVRKWDQTTRENMRLKMEAKKLRGGQEGKVNNNSDLSAVLKITLTPTESFPEYDLT